MMRLATLFLFSFMLIMSCKSDDDSNPNTVTPSEEEPNPTTNNTVPHVTPSGDEQYLQLNSDYVFDQSTLNTYELYIPQSSYAQLNNDPAAEQYVEGSLIFQGDTISPVGIRYKGSIGAFVGCLTGEDWSNPSGSKVCTKLSMKVKINWEGRDDRFFGLRKLQFHSMNLDDSQMRERLAYWLFREMGVPAPRSVHARLMINGEFSGLYALTEQIDGRFTRYNFDNGEGNLYKEIWPLKMNGQPFSESNYIAALKTNEDENPSAEMIRTFATEISQANDDDIQSVIEKWMNVDEIISYAVVDRTIRVDDGPFHWYCDGNSCSPHNFYWYEEPTEGTVHLIPWDMDNAFENIIFNQNPVTPIADAWGQTTNNCQPFSFGAFQLTQWSAACDKLTGGWASFTDLYDEKLNEFKSGPLSEDQAIEQLNTWAEQIRQATEEAHDKHDDAISISQWESSLSQLKGQVNFAREN